MSKLRTVFKTVSQKYFTYIRRLNTIIGSGMKIPAIIYYCACENSGKTRLVLRCIKATKLFAIV